MYLVSMTTQMTKCIHIPTKIKREISFQISSNVQTENMIPLLSSKYFLYWIMHQYTDPSTRNHTDIPPQNKLCILANKISGTKPYRSQMDVDVDAQRQAINNYTFKNEPDIGKAVSDWTCTYNEKQGRRITDILQIGVMSMTT